jgi:tryptophan-rich sensory protein
MNVTGRRSLRGLMIWLSLCFAAAAVGSVATGSNIDGWYAGLRKPVWTPPNWVFAPTWTLLYLAMALAAWRVWREQGLRAAQWPLGLFGVQLTLNAAWSWLFFAWKRPDVALVELCALWVAIAATTVVFARRDRWAGLLMTPYLAWVTFAVTLNLSIWRLNC